MKSTSANHILIAVHVTNRVRQASEIQEVFTCFGANIKTRLGLHDADGRKTAPSGIILLEMVGAPQKCLSIVNRLNAIKGVEAKPVVFEHA